MARAKFTSSILFRGVRAISLAMLGIWSAMIVVYAASIAWEIMRLASKFGIWGGPHVFITNCTEMWLRVYVIACVVFDVLCSYCFLGRQIVLFAVIQFVGIGLIVAYFVLDVISVSVLVPN